MCPSIVSGIVTGDTPISYREDKSLRHAAIVANFMDDNKPKMSLKKWIHTVSNFNLTNVGEIFWVEPERTASKFTEKKKKIFVVCSPTP